MPLYIAAIEQTGVFFMPNEKKKENEVLKYGVNQPGKIFSPLGHPTSHECQSMNGYLDKVAKGERIG